MKHLWTDTLTKDGIFGLKCQKCGKFISALDATKMAVEEYEETTNTECPGATIKEVVFTPETSEPTRCANVVLREALGQFDEVIVIGLKGESDIALSASLNLSAYHVHYYLTQIIHNMHAGKYHVVREE